MRRPFRLKLASPSSRVSGAEDGIFSRPISPTKSAGRMKRAGLCAALATAFVVFAFSAASASAASPSPGYTIDSLAAPTHFSEADNAECPAHAKETVVYRYCEGFQVFATNAGSEPTSGTVALTDTVPAGLTVVALELRGTAPGLSVGFSGGGLPPAAEHCATSGQVVHCTWQAGLAPDQFLNLIVYVTVDTTGSLTNQASVSGGGAAPASTTVTNEVSSESAPFGVSDFNFFSSGLDGARDSQAGDHPYELHVTFDMNNAFALNEENGTHERQTDNVGRIKDIVVDLPLGFIGSTLAAPQCPISLLAAGSALDGGKGGCPADTVVGYLLTEPNSYTGIASPIYNLVPERGHPAEFGYLDVLGGAHVFYTQVVPTPQGYVLQTSSNVIPETNLRRISVTFYGDPAEKQAELKQRELEEKLHTTVPREEPPTQVPFFTNPTLCSGGPQVATLYIDSWENPGSFLANGTPNLTDQNWHEYKSESPPVQGCDHVSFTPELKVQPTTNQADSPTGLEFEAKLAQPEAFGTPATSPLKDLSVTFPQGMTVDPSSADGLGTCSEAQMGWLGPDGPNGEALPNGGLTNFNPAKPECPESSKIGTLELESPLIPGKIYGEVFLASQNANPFDSTFALYVVVNDPVTGVVIKIPGELKANPSTGQLTSVFDENPQLPFSILQVHFFGGPRAELATPPNCGIYTTHSEFAPWSIEASELPAEPFSNYLIDEDCAIGFDPAFTGGSTNLQAGAYTTFQASFERQDSDQELAGATINLPPGMLADVPSVTECGDAELAAEAADAPTGGCPASSQVGTVEAGAGPGPNPLFVPGKVFWTGPYNGGPFGLAVVVSANPGPFHFGNVLVRQSIRVNPITAAVTDVSAPFPTYLDPVGPNGQTTGIPIKLRRVDVEINRPGFTFNPTSCAKETFKVAGAITSVVGASKALSTPFQVTNCAHLKFAPSFSVTTSGKTSKADGASLTAKVTYPSGTQGIYADIAKVKVELPKALPSRLTTLQKACTAAQFEANPAGCPSPSFIGHATVSTPILPGGLSGPAIFVSHGGEAFPSLEIVLQGDGVTIDLVGATFISKAGVTSTTFKTIPDSPFSTFELTLPEGPYSALAANGNLCKPTTTKTVKKKVTVKVHGKKKIVTRKVKETVAGSLVMPNEFIGQNGAEIHEDTTIKVIGCPPARAKSKPVKKAHKKKRRK